ncbi:hypothetical protein KCP74_06170 [Salmonella enterica subsp. enterica]|nr:hypothetical protein KCP74_06170 [Salmonella enterica subsp. enterica]
MAAACGTSPPLCVAKIPYYISTSGERCIYAPPLKVVLNCNIASAVVG